ncbi:CD63 [Acanthosepion pharaonis]|uniref:CD63 n=1 Tax=Acanthosepion pharaonis TaxID=158019 RepID=A0A812DI07_ACAPH|nr:CD63 [Sepia pharaonis]
MESAGKFVMYFTALVLFALSVILLLVGVNTFYHFSSYTSVLNYHLLSPAGVTIFFGLTLINVSFLGLLGVFCRSFLLLSLFQLLLFLLLVFEVLIGIILATLRYGTYPPIATAMLNSEERYKGNTAVARAWNEIHSHFSCCGTSQYNEWYPFFGNVCRRSPKCVAIISFFLSLSLSLSLSL